MHTLCPIRWAIIQQKLFTFLDVADSLDVDTDLVALAAKQQLAVLLLAIALLDRIDKPACISTQGTALLKVTFTLFFCMSDSLSDTYLVRLPNLVASTPYISPNDDLTPRDTK